MTKKDAQIISERITNEQLQLMFDNAKGQVKDWTVVSACNKGFTKGVAWNILAKDFDINKEYRNIAKYNMVREFGDYLPNELKVPKTPKPPKRPPTHHDPIF